MSDVRWEGFSHEEIYSRVQQGPGPLASADAEAAWSTVESTIRTVDAQLTRAVKQIGAGWQGRAAEAVQGGMTVMSNWALDAAGDASLTKNGISAQAEQAGRLRSAMPPPRTAEWNRIVQEEVPGVGLMSAMGDLGALEEQMADDHAVAVEMMNRYSSQSSDNQRLMNYWTQPPTVVVEAASARSTTSTAPLGAAGAVGARSGAGGAGRFAGRWFVEWRRRRPVVGRRAGCGRVPGRRPAPHRRPAAVAVQARPRRSGRRTASGRAVSDRRRYPDGHPGPSIRTRTHRSAGQGRFPEPPPTVAIPPRCREQARSPSESARAPRAGRRERSDGGRDPILPSAAASAPSSPGHPPGPGVPPTGAPACAPHPPPIDTAEPPARAPRTPAPGVGEPPPRRGPPRKPPPSGRPRDARPPRATGSCRWAVPCGPRSRRTRGAAYLIDDTDAFADDRWFPPPVISGDALVSPRGG